VEEPEGEPVSAEPYLLVKPTTYMNLSGEAAAALQQAHGLAPSEMLIIVDDIHLKLGDLRLRRGGSHGGHNGLRSLAECLGTTDQPRLRVGVGSPSADGDLINFVLSPFEPDEEPIVDAAVRSAAEIARAFGQGGFERASAAYGRWKAGRSG
jgi:PTH1 family peptidyl-tRNA hydrolase